MSIYKKRNHTNITKEYDFSNYDKMRRYDKTLIGEVRDLIKLGYTSSDIIAKTNLPKGQKTNTFLYRQREYVKHEMEKMGIE